MSDHLTTLDKTRVQLVGSPIEQIAQYTGDPSCIPRVHEDHPRIMHYRCCATALQNGHCVAMEPVVGPIRSAEAMTWADRQSGPPESRIVPERTLLRTALPAVQRLPRKVRGYGKAVALRLLSPPVVRLTTSFATIVSSRNDHGFIRPVFDEPFETALLWRLIEPGSTFIDVGANRGWYTLLAARRVGEEGRVLAFEPNDEARRVLDRNLRANPDIGQLVEVLPFAVAEEDGSARFVKDRESALSHLERIGDESGSTNSVPVRSLCSVLSEIGETRVGVIKIDVEGAEARVLAGLVPCLGVVDVQALLVEVEADHLARFGSSIDAVIQSLEPTHTSYWVCWRHGQLEEASGQRCADAGRNILALPRDTADATRSRLFD